MHAHKCGPIIWTLFQLFFIFHCFIFTAQDFSIAHHGKLGLEPSKGFSPKPNTTQEKHYTRY